MKPLPLRRSRNRAAATLCLGLSASAAIQPGFAEPAAANSAAVYQFEIAAQPLYSALSRLAEQTGVQFVYAPDLVSSLQAPALSGRMSAAQALQKLLAGSGLAHKAGQGNSVILEKTAVNDPQSAPGSTTLPSVTVVGKSSYLDDNDPRSREYAKTHSAAATKTDTPIFDTAASIQVVPRAVMEDQKNTRIKDALENVSGVRAQPTLGMGTGFIVRGFKVDHVFRNGLITTQSNGFNSEFDIANLESVEILKGPSAMLYGRSEPGGLINVTTKKPSETPFYSLEQQFGSYDHYRTQWDATGPLNDDKTLLYRFSGSYQDNNSFRDLIFTDRVSVSPSITWKPSDATDFTLNVEGLKQDYQADFGIPAVGTRPADIPIGNSFGDPNDPVDHLTKVHLGTEFNHRFNQDWAIHNRFLMSRENNDQVFINPSPAFDNALLADNRTLGRNIFSQENEVEAYTTNLDLTGKFQLLGMQHDALVGFDYTLSHTMYHTQGDWQNRNPALDIDIFNPRASYGIPTSLFDSTLATYVQPGREYSMFVTEWYGAYFQDHITLWDKLHIYGGGRYDWAEVGRGRGATEAAAENALDYSNPSVKRKDEAFSPRVGILYQPWHWLSVYGSWSNSFGANNGITAAGQALAPETGEQFEAGIKTQLFDDRLLATLAYYHLTKNNIMTADLSTPDPTDNAAIGEARSQGIELDVSGRLSDNFSIISSYAFTDARITKNNDGYEGTRLPNVAEHSGSLWLRFDANGYQAAEGFSMGLGGVLAGKREGNYAYYGSPFQLPGYVRVDAFAAYKWNVHRLPVTVQFNIRNLLDKTYYESTDPDANVSPRNGVYPGAPLMAIGSVKVEF
ncbi:TonB-dependent receptor [Methylomonas sp. SURF-1]|uniref:TonB-dependent receptor n=1 Tax=Methylomonas aurea TaxID=2952224 RepID=A0ABT1ULF4_9GAMM|nr:TonB-dependent receptor [Methylomonas sp. SURF-1]MCQ8182937.1 TonB-dependent receptor [Methylomonas sp. SURF-1]